jgi:hypothetical protein
MKNDSECRRASKRWWVHTERKRLWQCARKETMPKVKSNFFKLPLFSFFQLLLSLHYRPHHRRRSQQKKKKLKETFFLFLF